MYAVSIVALVASILTALPLGWGRHAALAAAVGGAIGGLGLALATATVHDHLFFPWLLLGAAFASAVFALPFGNWIAVGFHEGNSLNDPLQQRRFEYALAIWQAAMGTYLYAATRPEWRRLRPRWLDD